MVPEHKPPRDGGTSRTELSAEESIRTRSRENRLQRWVFLDGHRGTIVVALSVGVAVMFYLLGLADVIGVSATGAVSGAFTAAITGVFTLVTITVSINQLVLSRILGSPETIRDRVRGVHRFRDDVESISPAVAVAPTDPAPFLRTVTDALRTQAEELERTYGPRHDPSSREAVAELVETLTELSDHVEERLDAGTGDLYAILSPVLNNSYSTHIDTLVRIRERADSLDADEAETMDDLARTLELVNVTRHYFKTMYILEELATVSRFILLTGFPAAAVSFVMVFLYGRGMAPALGETTLLVAVSAAMGVVFVPLSILFAYGIRLATIAKRTTTFGTFTPEEEMP